MRSGQVNTSLIGERWSDSSCDGDRQCDDVSGDNGDGGVNVSVGGVCLFVCVALIIQQVGFTVSKSEY